MPDNRIQIIEPDSPTNNADIRMQWKDKVPSEITSSDTDIPDDTNETPSGNKNPVDVPPDLFQFKQKCLVILNVSKLIGVFVVAFETPIGRRRNNKMD